MKLLNEQATFAKNVASLIKFIFDSKHLCTIGEAFRTEEQAISYAKRGKGIVDSLHCKRLAIDLNLFTQSGEYLSETESYKSAGQYWENLHPHNRWGGKFLRADGNHFEMVVNES